MNFIKEDRIIKSPRSEKPIPVRHLTEDSVKIETPPVEFNWSEFTEEECNIMRWKLESYTDMEVSQKLGISRPTLSKKKDAIKEKLRRRLQAAS